MAQPAHAEKVNMLVPGLVSLAGWPGQSPALIGSRCDYCGAVVFPRIAVCPRCRSPKSMQLVEIGRRGKIYSFTIARVASIGFQAPYFQAYIDLPEGPRIFSLISDTVPVSEKSLYEGMEVELVVESVRRDPSGTAIFTYKYRPLNISGGRT